jgi:NitT/TauT family transport system substrate-binding protein
LTIDVAQTGTEIAGSTIAAGGDIAIVGISLPNNVLFLAARNDVSLPNRAKGFPSVMQDFKGLKIGVSARGTGAEIFLAARQSGSSKCVRVPPIHASAAFESGGR